MQRPDFEKVLAQLGILDMICPPGALDVAGFNKPVFDPRSNPALTEGIHNERRIPVFSYCPVERDVEAYSAGFAIPGHRYEKSRMPFCVDRCRHIRGIQDRQVLYPEGGAL